MCTAASFVLTRERVLQWLQEQDESCLRGLWQLADETRRLHVGDEVHLRGLVELSNHCRRSCHYCGIRAANASLPRYRMSRDEIMACAHQAVRLGYGTLVLQAGEDPGLDEGWIREIVLRVKSETPLALTLSLGERTLTELAAWKEAGADRYLLRFETSNRDLFRQIHPPCPGMETLDRIALLRELRALGYEVGSGVMVGIPGQVFDDLARDLELFRELDLDMIGVGPFIAHPATPLGRAGVPAAVGQVPNSELMTLKMLALTRLMCPQANLPSTTALATIDLAEGRELGLRRGANVVMPNLSPPEYRELYEIYPSKACVRESGGEGHRLVLEGIARVGRLPGRGPGARRRG